nr:hypothetical protein [Tanacetum cinerariifolium]
MFSPHWQEEYNHHWKPERKRSTEIITADRNWNGGASCNGGDEVVDKDGGEVVEDGGAEVVDNIVAKLPTTLSEDKVPASAPPADEASILIHSIIHD